MGFLEGLLDKTKFSQREFELCKINLEKLFKEEIQSHKNKQFIKIQLFQDSYELCVSNDKFSIYFKKKILNSKEIVIKSNIDLFNISKNNIEKNSIRIKWIIETVDKVIKLCNSSLEKIELFSKIYEDVILADLRKFGIILQSVKDKNYLYLYNNEFNFELKNNGYYEFRLNTSTSSIITKEKLSYINKVRDTVLKYWNKF
jgi:hypothetical protein|nr:MAG TPA: hypothetical protein [Herelleviridae sp.]